MRPFIALAALLLAACGGPAQDAPATGVAPTVAAPTSGQLLLLELDAAQSSDSEVLEKTAGILRKRLADAGIASGSVTPIPPNRVEVRVPAAPDSAGPISILTRPGILSFHLADSEADPASYQPGIERDGLIALPDDSLGGAARVIEARAVMTNTELAGAEQGVDQSGNPNLMLTLTPDGAQTFSKVTAANVGRAIAIVLDRRIMSAPVIMTPITGGSAQITGQFSLPEAKRLALVLRSGALPVPVRLVETSTFSAQ